MFFVSTSIIFVVCVLGRIEAVCTVNEDITTCRNVNLLRILLNALQSKQQDNTTRPGFFASLSQNTVLTDMSSIVKFDDVRINIGNGYDSTTGWFTAPRSGIYEFICLIRATGNNQVHFQLNTNDAPYTLGYASKGYYDSQTISSTVKLMENDRVCIKHRISTTETVNGSHTSTFSGKFLQE